MISKPPAIKLDKLSFDEKKEILEEYYQFYNTTDFIPKDPIAIPHLFDQKEDIEIAGLIAAIFAWGNRQTILNKSKEFLTLMDNAPYDFILNAKDADLKPFANFKHRTFNGIDAGAFIKSLNNIYNNHGGLEGAISQSIDKEHKNVKEGLIKFKELFLLQDDFPSRTKKHIASPTSNSSCKRLNMYLRWMVRSDARGVDFGIWSKIKPAQLVCPCDVHVIRVATFLGLNEQSIANWTMAETLTNKLAAFDAADPVKYDFALFGLGVNGVY